MSAHLPPRGWTWAVLGLGSNLGDRLSLLQGGIDALAADARITVDAVSSVYETEPQGGPPQDPYLNIAVRISTRHSPRRLLRACAAAEQEAGRVRTERWGPRTLDVDILVYADRVVATRSLIIPHPRLRERAFALVPLMEVAPGLTLPDGTSVAQAIAALAPVEGITVVGTQVAVPQEPAGEAGS